MSLMAAAPFSACSNSARTVAGESGTRKTCPGHVDLPEVAPHQRVSLTGWVSGMVESCRGTPNFLEPPKAELRRTPLPRRWVNRRYDASSVDDPGYKDTVREDFDRIADLSEAQGWDRRVVMGPRRPGSR